MEFGSYIISYCKVMPNGILTLFENVNKQPKKYYENEKIHDITTEISKPKDVLSENSVRMMKKAMMLLISISPIKSFISPKTLKKSVFRINFITLTLSAKQGIETDYKIKRELLNHFIIRAKQRWNMQNYVWKAEAQANGNIHFHIVTNVYIDYQELRDEWNNIQKKLGFIDLFNEKHHHINPNSTDIHTVVKIKNISAYASKYMSKENRYSKKLQKYIKNEQKEQKESNRNYSKLSKDYFSNIMRNIVGKKWGCSRNLLIKNDDYILIEGIEKIMYDNILQKFGHRTFFHDYFQFIPLSEIEIQSELPLYFTDSFNRYLDKVRTS